METASIMAKKVGRPRSSESTVRVSAFGLRSTPEWRDWVLRMADKERVGVSDLVDRALALYAEHIKFELPPKR
jgi:hypothetical protein